MHIEEYGIWAHMSIRIGLGGLKGYEHKELSVRASDISAQWFRDYIPEDGIIQSWVAFKHGEVYYPPGNTLYAELSTMWGKVLEERRKK